MPDCTKEMYSMFCEKRFDKIDDHQEQILNILKGKNGNPGLIDDVRQLKSRWMVIFGALIVVFSALGTQLVKWIFTVL